MGLDMYLYRREYVSGWAWDENSTKERDMYNTVLEYTGAQRCEGSPHANIEVCVAYWRKANAIHKWFCDLDGGKDECQPIYVTRDNLITLRDLCESVILQPVMAESTLPTQQGFFFGSYEYDDWYMEDIRLTVDQLNNILETPGLEAWTSFIYQASW